MREGETETGEREGGKENSWGVGRGITQDSQWEETTTKDRHMYNKIQMPFTTSSITNSNDLKKKNSKTSRISQPCKYNIKAPQNYGKPTAKNKQTNITNGFLCTEQMISTPS